eukprot:14046644-Alexandrium_andersonii.AAC.1
MTQMHVVGTLSAMQLNPPGREPPLGLGGGIAPRHGLRGVGGAITLHGTSETIGMILSGIGTH